MPRTRGKRHIANAVKDRGTSKRRTKELTDQARPRGVRTPVRDTATGQGGSTRRGGRARGPHPGTRGGIRAEEKNIKARGEPVPRTLLDEWTPQIPEPRRTRLNSAKHQEKTAGRQQPPSRGKRRTGQKRASAGLIKSPSRQRLGSAVVGGRTRTGKDRSGPRGRARGGSRTRGRSPNRP